MRELEKYYRAEPMYNTRYEIKELMRLGRSTNCFSTREEAEADFLKAQQIALSKYNQVLEGLDALRERLVAFHFDYYMKGDTYGIYEDGSYIGFTVNNYEFKFLQEGGADD